MIARNPELLFPLRGDLIASSHPDSLAPYREVLKLFGLDAAFEGVVKESITRNLLLKTDEHSIQGAMATDLDKMEGIVIRAPKDAPFITSSFPVFPVIKEIDGEKHLTSLYFPLCSEAAIIYGISGYTGIRRRSPVDASIVNKLNIAFLYSNYGEFLIAKYQEALERLLAPTGR